MPRHTGRVTIRDVARRANVSVATVSRVLNQSGYVSPAIEGRVLLAKNELGYYQDSVARSLKTNSTKTIGFVTSDIANAHLMTIAREVEELINKKGYNLLVCSTEDDQERELAYLELLFSRKIDGLILNGTGQNDEFLLEMNATVPTVLMYRRIRSPGFVGDLVDSDNIGGTYALTKHLLDWGHRDIFAISGPPTLSNSKERLEGFKMAMMEVGSTVDSAYPYLYYGDFSLKSGYAAIEYMMQLHPLPTAVVSMNNMMTIGALKCLRAKNVNLPEDISIVSYNRLDHMELMSVRPTVLNYDTRAMGVRAGHCLLERLADNRIENREFIFKGQMESGNAVGMPPIHMGEGNLSIHSRT